MTLVLPVLFAASRVPVLLPAVLLPAREEAADVLGERLCLDATSGFTVIDRVAARISTLETPADVVAARK